MSIFNLKYDAFGSIFTVLKGSLELLNPYSGIGSKDLDAILQNREDRILLDKTIEELKLSGEKSKKVRFSDRELIISID